MVLLVVEVVPGNVLPLEVERPVEAALGDHRLAVLERAGVDQVHHGHHHRLGVVLDRLEQRGKPVVGHLTVAVQEDENIPGGQSRSYGLQRLLC